MRTEFMRQKYQWRTSAYTVMNFRVPKKGGGWGEFIAKMGEY